MDDEEAWLGCRDAHETRCRQGHCPIKETDDPGRRGRRIRHAYGPSVLTDAEIVGHVLAGTCGPKCCNK